MALLISSLFNQFSEVVKTPVMQKKAAAEDSDEDESEEEEEEVAKAPVHKKGE
jgi:CO dehydrogenase/acetyl-CoA synthase beta subunit